LRVTDLAEGVTGVAVIAYRRESDLEERSPVIAYKWARVVLRGTVGVACGTVGYYSSMRIIVFSPHGISRSSFGISEMRYFLTLYTIPSKIRALHLSFLSSAPNTL